ncbi:MAG: CooT family nickel-binding protein [Methanobacteriota archaeon]|nr:MAG: CooT family nickel-binding protein [Euryarchaeota archaeon]
MCESAVYLVSGDERTLVMQEAAKVMIVPEGVVCLDTLGERKLVEGAVLDEANLVKHEILLKPGKG